MANCLITFSANSTLCRLLLLLLLLLLLQLTNTYFLTEIQGSMVSSPGKHPRQRRNIAPTPISTLSLHQIRQEIDRKFTQVLFLLPFSLFPPLFSSRYCSVLKGYILKRKCL